MASNDDVLEVEPSAEDQGLLEGMDESEETGLVSKSKRKGRGFKGKEQAVKYDDLDDADIAPGAPQRSVEGWIVMVRNVHEEAAEEDLQDKFAEFGNVRGLHLNLDRRTGYAKGYALVEYETQAEATKAIEEGTGADLLGQELQVDWAFVKGKKSVQSRLRRD
eukprot:TRINITY_DN8518_c0_g1_i2.p1 TRINITY_DN8518_c0_g1~~TRINITY_DN8518_c0_g1_i2.p1  ORF type:complete len:163 (+),score=42.10 TRINITY_DN8518_c0_g1_i2:33-521(+)